LRPRNRAGFLFLLIVSGWTAGAIALSLQARWLLWAVGQTLLAGAFVVWFVILHEAGHRTLFRSRVMNLAAGHLAGFFALIPYESWQRIHARHHRWTGWQDMDASTASLVARPLAWPERWAVNAAWFTGFPLFSTIYRFSNYWNFRRLAPFLKPNELPRVRRAVLLALLGYSLLAWLVGPLALLKLVGLGRFLASMIEDPLLLSQHTHLPQNLARGEAVRPFPPEEQQPFTRSLRLPAWMSWLVLHFDAHELHHMFVRVPGYDLRRLDARPGNEVGAWTWLRGVKRLRGADFLFKNRNETGFPL
jgi:fatty acid desaturase